MFGHIYRCSVCPEYYVCTKCHRISGDFHPCQFPPDTREHIVALGPESKDFQEPDEQPPDRSEVMSIASGEIMPPASVNYDTTNIGEVGDDELQEMALGSDESF
jgi:hypothetical protein